MTMIFRVCLALCIPALIGACSTLGVQPLPQPLRASKPLPPAATPVEAGAAEQEADGPGLTRTPGVVIQKSVAEGAADRLGEGLTGPPIELSFHDVPLVTFINEVFGEQLGLSFHLAPDLREKTDLVTLRLTEPLPPSQLFATARRVLQDYGVSMRDGDGLLTFAADQEIVSGDIPLLISGRTLPEVPATHREIFQLVPFKVITPSQARQVLSQAFENSKLRTSMDVERNAMLLRGNVSTVARALDIIEVLDQPSLRGRFGLIIEPRFLDAAKMAKDLAGVLEAEGYATVVGNSGVGAIALLPLSSANKLAVFAQDQDSLDHVQEWARTLDAKRRESVEDGVFTYQVQNTQAELMMDTLNGVLGIRASEPVPEGAEATARPQRTPAAGGLIVDKTRNMLLFRGPGKTWADLLSVIDELDKPVPSVLIELLLAEVTLQDEQESGIGFLLREGLGGDLGLDNATLTVGSRGVSAKGLSLTLNNAGTARAALRMFYDDSRITIRSRPRLLVKSGETARLEVGNEIPVISQRSESNIQREGTTDIVQQVTYRKTGVILEIEPIVQANGLVDLTISQQLSEARVADITEVSGTPTILNRQIETSLTLRDGGSLLMGGLISRGLSTGQVGLPGLGRLPGVGRLFRSDTYQEDRTELLVMVIPYVVSDFEDGRELTELIQSELELHQRFTRE